MKTSELTLIELANELKRLASIVARDARRSSELTCLTSLTAMQPLQNLMVEALTSEIAVANKPPSDNKTAVGFCK